MRKLLLGLFAGLVLLLGAAPAMANGRADYIPSLDPGLRRQIQLVLKHEGFYRGATNGVFGATSQAALRRFRTARGIAGESEDDGMGGRHDLSLYLTPRLIQALFHFDVGTGTGTEELTMCQLMQVMRRLHVVPRDRSYDDFISLDAEGNVTCPAADETIPSAEPEQPGNPATSH